MHEMSLAEGVLQILEDNASSQGYSRVKTVWLEIGQLSDVEPEAMRFCFDAVVKGTLAEGARLEIVSKEGQGWCMTCAKTVALPAKFEPCPLCGGYMVNVTGGDEMRVKELEVE
jgi:hydrogenase nickel incorporation protein HypA/HybF